MDDVMEQTEPASVSCEEDKVHRVVHACDPASAHQWKLQQRGFVCQLRLACFLGKTRKSVVFFDTTV